MSFCRKNRGRPKIVNELLLEQFSRWWFNTLEGMRDGRPGFRTFTIPSVSIAILRKSFKEGLAVARLAVGPTYIHIVATDPAEVDLLQKLSEAETATQVKLACKQSRMWKEKEYVREIFNKANEFIRNNATRDVTGKSRQAEPRIWGRLLRAETVNQVRSTAYSSRYWLNPRRRGGRVWLRVLSKQADQFLRAKEDPRYPRSNRPSSEDKKLRYLARALAGISLGVSYRTAVDLLEKTRGDLKNPLGRFAP
jgi:hypothetical protein